MTNPIDVWRRKMSQRELLGKQGKVVVWTRIEVAPEEYESYVPYYVAIVKLQSGELVYGQLVDVQEPEIKKGLKVIGILRRSYQPSTEDVVVYTVKFKSYE